MPYFLLIIPAELESTMKLYIHQKSFREEHVIINPNDFPSIKIGDFLEIFHPDDKQSHLLVQVQTLSVELPQKGVVSVEQGVASLFQLRAYQTVQVRRVEPDSQDVALDLVELVFKDQYISRSDMYRLKNNLVNSCLHIQQKVEKCGIRAQVQDLWSRGGNVACGVVTSDTRVAFRSATAMVFLFIQMSSEMWDFDTCGDLYMEKAVNGFLIELFTRWKEKNSNHELSIVLFSRTYFKTDSIDNFPAEMQPRLHVHEDGRFYEDYYRVFAQNERREDWLQVLAPLKATMQRYAKDIKDWQRKVGCVLKGKNSSACQGNLLEALNLSLNVFDNHYMNRNFDRTGQLVVMVTPGAGVFEVDRTLCKLTEQRMIDYGIGSDVVCLAEQPLHPVPLLKFRDSLEKESVSSKEKYNIPHWLNYSFYLSPSQKRRYQSTQTSFISRLRLPDRIDEDSPRTPNGSLTLPKVASSGRFHGDSCRSTSSSESSCGDPKTTTVDERDEDDDEKFEKHDGKLFQQGRRRMSKVQSLNNPFCPDTLSVILTADRRRWTHAFPHGPNGEMIQLHHRQLVKVPSEQDILDPTPSHTPGDGVSQSSSGSSLNSASAARTSAISHGWWVRVDTRRRRGCVWGITGEQAWTPFLQTGMDWKSMTSTACFPITTDFYPLKQALDRDYQERPYTICIEGESDADANLSSVSTIFQELISQRLIQDFQLVVLPQQEQAGLTQRSRKDQPLATDPSKDVCVLSYANAFHKLTLSANDIEVVLYTPRESCPSPKLSYIYTLWPLHKHSYEIAHTRMYHKPVENDRWNYRDSYISFGGMASREGFELQECVKFWRSRFVLLPSHSSTLRQMSEKGYQGKLDVFQSEEGSSKHHLVEGFLRFFEGLNRRRTRLNVPSVSGSRSQRVSQGDISQSATSPGYRKIAHSGTSTPTGLHASLSLTTGTLHGLLSSVVASRKEDPSSEPGSPKSPDKKDGRPHQASPYTTIVKAMRDPSTGLGFIGGDHRGLPSDCFTSAEAVSWIRKAFIDQPSHEQAVKILQEMLNEGYIYSVFSIRGAKQIIYGYYVYCLPDSQSESMKNGWKLVIGQPMYEIPPQREWFEAACTISQDRQNEQEHTDGPGICVLPVYKSIVLEMWNTDLEHMEYCHASFHSNYQPDYAFDMELQWLTSMPGLLNDLIMNWMRRAQSAGFHLVPSHVDPFCFWEDISDPLCSPVFIPISLPEGSTMDPDLLARVQELILTRFGFLANHTSCLSPLPGTASKDSPYASIHVQYIHVTGVTFALPTPTQADTTSPRPDELPCLCSAWTESRNNNSDVSRGTHLGHSTRRSRKRETPADPGFLWVNNHLLTKKWKSSASGDDAFREALLNDFRRLCTNEDGRLDELVTMATEQQSSG